MPINTTQYDSLNRGGTDLSPTSPFLPSPLLPLSLNVPICFAFVSPQFKHPVFRRATAEFYSTRFLLG